MGYPLTDITVYYSGTEIKDTPKDWTFRREVNFISDFYHNQLNKYKPPKTSRICLHVSNKNIWEKPNHFGSICSFGTEIDEKKYLSLTKGQKYKYLLDLIHNSSIEITKHLNWDKEPFENAYRRIIENNLEFRISHKLKKSQDKLKTAHTIIEKSEKQSILKISILFEGKVIEHQLLAKNNWWWYDSIYDLAQKCKWINKNCFGYISKDKTEYSFYDFEKKYVKSNMEFKKNDF